MLAEAREPKATTAEIQIFYTKTPDRDYDEIAKIEVGDTSDDWCIKQIKKVSREIGADGAIITGKVGSYGYVSGSGTSSGSYATTTGVSVGEGYGLIAIAIKYK